ncbi:MAG: glycosyltransferase [Candidatus Hydrogenedens sp.]|nr:glycosyltransferase [Candidatus Hydrogenedens sp.]
MMRDLLAAHVREVAVVPGAVDPEAFPYAPPPEHPDRKSILMTGRGEDPAKGADILLAAGEILALERDDFVIQITMPETTTGPAWFAALPWCDHQTTRDRYHAADICVVPSIWDEPFGMVALEAMAAGRPVCVSDTGGLRDTVEHGVSGLRFERGNPRALADALRRLLNDAALRRTLGEAARQRVEQQFTWDRIVGWNIEPLLRRCARGGR